MPDFHTHLRPIYTDDELEGGQYQRASQSISAALAALAGESDARREERNKLAEAGATQVSGPTTVRDRVRGFRHGVVGLIDGMRGRGPVTAPPPPQSRQPPVAPGSSLLAPGATRTTVGPQSSASGPPGSVAAASADNGPPIPLQGLVAAGRRDPAATPFTPEPVRYRARDGSVYEIDPHRRESGIADAISRVTRDGQPVMSHDEAYARALIGKWEGTPFDLVAGGRSAADQMALEQYRMQGREYIERLRFQLRQRYRDSDPALILRERQLNLMAQGLERAGTATELQSVLGVLSSLPKGLDAMVLPPDQQENINRQREELGARALTVGQSGRRASQGRPTDTRPKITTGTPTPAPPPAPRRGGAAQPAGKPSAAERVRQLSRQGLSREQIRAKLLSEGYR
jgi:hypothetical protein